MNELNGLLIEDAMMVVMLAAGRPVFPFFIVPELERGGFRHTGKNLRGVVVGRLQSLEREGLVERHQLGWKLTRKGKRVK